MLQVLGLKQKKEQIAIDKQKLLDTIALLDVKKTQEIHKAHAQVNRVSEFHALCPRFSGN